MRHRFAPPPVPPDPTSSSDPTASLSGPTPGLTPSQQDLVLSAPARGLVRRLARRFRPERDDAMQDYLMAGVTGLIEAALVYDPAWRHPDGSSVEFVAFARIYVVRHMEELKEQEHEAPRHAQAYVARLRRQGLDPSESDIIPEDLEEAAKLGKRPDTVCRQRREIASGRTRPASLEAQAAGECEDSLLDRAMDAAPSAEEEAMARLLRSEVRNAVGALPAHAHRAIHMMYYEGRSRAEIATRLSVTERTVTNWLAQGYAQLRVPLSRLLDITAAGRDGRAKFPPVRSLRDSPG